MKNIKTNKEKIIILTIIVVLLCLVGLTIFETFGSKHSAYGNRLKNIVEVDETAIKKIKDEISKMSNVNNVDYKKDVRVIKFFVEFDGKSENAKEIATPVLSNLSEKILNDYDIQIYITNDSDIDYPMIGYHSKSSNKFTWTLNKVVNSSEE